MPTLGDLTWFLWLTPAERDAVRRRVEAGGQASAPYGLGLSLPGPPLHFAGSLIGGLGPVWRRPHPAVGVGPRLNPTGINPTGLPTAPDSIQPHPPIPPFGRRSELFDRRNFFRLACQMFGNGHFLCFFLCRRLSEAVWVRPFLEDLQYPHLLLLVQLAQWNFW